MRSLITHTARKPNTTASIKPLSRLLLTLSPIMKYIPMNGNDQNIG